MRISLRMAVRKLEDAASKLDPRQITKIAKAMKKAQKAVRQIAKEIGDAEFFEIVLKDGTRIRGRATGKIYYIPSIPKVLIREIVIQEIEDLSALEIAEPDAGGNEGGNSE